MKRKRSSKYSDDDGSNDRPTKPPTIGTGKAQQRQGQAKGDLIGSTNGSSSGDYEEIGSAETDGENSDGDGGDDGDGY